MSTFVDHFRARAWYGVERDAVLQVNQCYERGRWWVLDLEHDVQARIPYTYATRLPDSAPEASFAIPVELADKPFTAKVADPTMFFRNPDERGFWKAIAHDPLDDTNRLVYADWLDDRGDPDARIFRERYPFDTAEFHGLKWDEAAAHLPRPDLNWSNLTIQATCGQFVDDRYHRYVRYHFSDSSPLPQFVAYLLLLIRLRMWIAEGQ